MKVTVWLNSHSKGLWPYCVSNKKQVLNSQLNKLKSGIKNSTEVTLKLLPNAVGDSNDEKIFA